MTTVRALTSVEAEAFRLGRLVAAETAPYYLRALFAATPVAAPGLGTFAVDGRWRLYLDPALLVGDAASLVCPTSGEGIGTGMISGYVAAHFVRKALENRRFDEEQFKNYDREIYRRLHSEIRLYNLMMALSPKIYDFGLNILAPNPLFRRFFEHRVGGWLRTAYEKEIEVRL